MSIISKVSEGIAKKAVQGKAFHVAYKAAPGQTMGTYAKTHKWGVGLTAASMAPLHGIRRSTHSGIDKKGVQQNGS